MRYYTKAELRRGLDGLSALLEALADGVGVEGFRRLAESDELRFELVVHEGDWTEEERLRVRREVVKAARQLRRAVEYLPEDAQVKGVYTWYTHGVFQCTMSLFSGIEFLRRLRVPVVCRDLGVYHTMVEFSARFGNVYLKQLKSIPGSFGSFPRTTWRDVPAKIAL